MVAITTALSAPTWTSRAGMHRSHGECCLQGPYSLNKLGKLKCLTTGPQSLGGKGIFGQGLKRFGDFMVVISR